MIIAPAHGFVLLAVPKVASTSLESALGGYHQVPPGSPVHKHQNLLGFHRHTAPKVEALGYRREQYAVVAMWRDPLAWLESWWRYRRRPDVRERRADRWTGDLPFAEFARLFLDDKDATGIKGRPAQFIAGSAEEGARLDRLFAVDRPEVWTAWFGERVGAPLEVPRRNSSTASRAEPLPDDLAGELRAWFAPEYVVCDRLAATGEWAPPAGYRPPGLD